MSNVTEALIRCPKCTSVSEYNIWVSANVTVSPHLKDEVLSGSLFWKECPKCNEGFSASHDLLYHDMEKQFCVWLKYENAAGEIEFEPGADRADRVFKGYQLRIVFVRDELIEKIKIDRDGYDDIFIEVLKVFQTTKAGIDLVSPVYYDRTEGPNSRKTIVFLHKPKGSEPMEYTMRLDDAEGVLEPFVPKIRAALKSDWSPWMWVSRATVLMTFEGVELLSRLQMIDPGEDAPASLVDKADRLITAAKSLARAALASAKQELELLDAITGDVDKWDFFVTVAGVFTALRQLPQTFADSTIEAIRRRVIWKLNEWNSQGSQAFEECQYMIESSLKAASNEQVELTVADAIGMWLLCGLYGRFPTSEETRSARPLGDLLLNAFDDWWVEAN